MTTLLLALIFVVGGTLAYIALRNAQDFSDANEIIPGVPTRAPKAWAGAHSPEARLHRRLRDAMETLRVNATLDDGSLADVRRSLEEQALATDEHLIAAATLAKGRREEPISRIAETVDAIEGLVADLVELRGPAVVDSERRIEEVRTRLALVAEAREELAGLESPTPDLSALRDRLESDADEAASPEDASGRDDEPGAEPAP